MRREEMSTYPMAGNVDCLQHGCRKGDRDRRALLCCFFSRILADGTLFMRLAQIQSPCHLSVTLLMRCDAMRCSAVQCDLSSAGYGLSETYIHIATCKMRTRLSERRCRCGCRCRALPPYRTPLPLHLGLS